MSDELFLEGKNYMSSKRAAESSGYAQDYIGQLARGGLIDAQRVGGLWYVSLDSLNAYQKNAEEYKPVVPAPKQASDLDTIVSFDGKDYISASKAAKLTGYNQDYIGQLARGGKILSRQIGNRWYIEREGLVAHKNQKDSLLAAVQSQAVGLVIPPPAPIQAPQAPLMSYKAEQYQAIPALDKKPEPVASPIQEELRQQYQVPIRVVRNTPAAAPIPMPLPRTAVSYVAPEVKTSGMSINRAIKSGVALTFVIVLSYGFVTFKDRSVYAVGALKGSPVSANAFTASATEAFGHVGDAIEHVLSPELVYIRAE